MRHRTLAIINDTKVFFGTYCTSMQHVSALWWDERSKTASPHETVTRAIGIAYSMLHP